MACKMSNKEKDYRVSMPFMAMMYLIGPTDHCNVVYTYSGFAKVSGTMAELEIEWPDRLTVCAALNSEVVGQHSNQTNAVEISFSGIKRECPVRGKFYKELVQEMTESIERNYDQYLKDLPF